MVRARTWLDVAPAYLFGVSAGLILAIAVAVPHLTSDPPCVCQPQPVPCFAFRFRLPGVVYPLGLALHCYGMTECYPVGTQGVMSCPGLRAGERLEWSP